MKIFQEEFPTLGEDRYILCPFTGLTCKDDCNSREKLKRVPFKSGTIMPLKTGPMRYRIASVEGRLEGGNEIAQEIGCKPDEVCRRLKPQ